METLKDHAHSIKQFIHNFEKELDVTKQRLENEWRRDVGGDLQQITNYLLFDLHRSIDALYAQCQTLDVILAKIQCEKENQ